MGMNGHGMSCIIITYLGLTLNVVKVQNVAGYLGGQIRYYFGIVDLFRNFEEFRTAGAEKSKSILFCF